MTSLKKLLAGAALAALAACATGETLVRPPASSTASGPIDESHIGTLAPRKLAAGECGLFLWSKAADRSLIFFNTRAGAGKMKLGGREVDLVRTSADGAELLGQFERQTFSYETLLVEIEMSFERRPGLARGALVPQGAVRLKRDDGWEYIFPVGGLVGCEEA